MPNAKSKGAQLKTNTKKRGQPDLLILLRGFYYSGAEISIYQYILVCDIHQYCTNHSYGPVKPTHIAMDIQHIYFVNQLSLGNFQ